jgi:hypothetical protein
MTFLDRGATAAFRTRKPCDHGTVLAELCGLCYPAGAPMRLYVWAMNLDTGVYRENGSAIVAAANLADAIDLLRAYDARPEAEHPYAAAAVRTAPTTVLTLAKTEPARIIVVDPGSDN